MKRSTSRIAGLAFVAGMILAPGCGEDAGTDIVIIADDWVTVQGIVRDYTTNAGVPGATVQLFVGSTMTTGTDAAGYWSIPNVPVRGASINAQIRFSAPGPRLNAPNGYAPYTRAITITSTPLQNWNAYIAQLVTVNGFVFASGTPADGATVIFTFGNSGNLYPAAPNTFNPTVDAGQATDTTAADGSFSLVNVPANVIGTLVVPAFDVDGVPPSEFDTYTQALTANEYAGNNTSVVVNLPPATVNVTVSWTNVENGATIGPTDAILGAFSVPVTPANVQVDLYFHPGDNNINNAPTGAQVFVPAAVSYTLNNTFVTVTPSSPLDTLFTGGGGTFQIEIAERYTNVPAGASGQVLTAYVQEFRVVDVDPTTIPVSPGGLAFDNDGFSEVVDSRFYIITDSAFTPDDPQYYREIGMNVPLQWGEVSGAIKYNIYARQILPTGTMTSWIRAAEITSFVVVNNRVEGRAILDSADFATFDVYPDATFTTGYGVNVIGVQAFAEGRQVEFTVTAVDASNRESAIDPVLDPTSVLTLGDTWVPEMLRQSWINQGLNDLNGGGADVNYNFFGGLTGGDVTLAFNEPVVETNLGSLTVSVPNNSKLVVIDQWRSFPGQFSMSVDVQLVGLTATLVSDYSVNNRFDFTAPGNGTNGFWLGQRVDVLDMSGNWVADADINQIHSDATTEYLDVTFVSGMAPNLVPAGYRIRGQFSYRQGIDVTGAVAGWTSGATDDILDTNVAMPFDLGVGDVIMLTYLDAGLIMNFSSTISNLEIDGFGNTLITMTAPTPITLAAGNIIRFERLGDKFTIGGIRDPAGNAINGNSDTVHMDAAGNIVVTGN